VFAERGRVVTNNAASTQPPAGLSELYRSLGPGYENVHRGQSGAWNRQLTARALAGLAATPGITIYGPADACRRTSLVAFNLAGRDPVHGPKPWTGPGPRPGPARYRPARTPIRA
jgi:hypothetical protein